MFQSTLFNCLSLVPALIRHLDYSPMKLLRTFPPLEAQSIIGITVTLVRDLPEELYDELVRHPYEARPEDYISYISDSSDR